MVSKKISPRSGKHTHLRHISHRIFIFTAVAFIVSIFIIAVFGFFPEFTPQAPSICGNSLSCAKDLSGQIAKNTEGTYMGHKVSAPNLKYFTQEESVTSVLGTQTTSGQKHIFIDLSSQHLYAYQDSTLVYSFTIASGKWNLTPTGTFQVWIKLQAALMAGGEGSDAYYLPNVPWV